MLLFQRRTFVETFTDQFMVSSSAVYTVISQECVFCGCWTRSIF